MLRSLTAATAASLLLVQPAQAQDTPDPRDLAMAAGYKALMLCGAIASAERAGAARTADSVDTWELSGIYPEAEPHVERLDAQVVRREDGSLRYTAVPWNEAMPPRYAVARKDAGCSIAPIGSAVEEVEAALPKAPPPVLEGSGSGWPAGETTVAAKGRLAGVFGRAMADDYGAGARTTGVVVVKGGKLLGEAYAAPFGPNVPQRTWSVAKSIAATLAGAAVQRGDASIDSPLPIKPWWRAGDPRKRIVLDDLLRMTSGLTSDTAGNRTDAIYFGGASVEDDITDWPLLHPPQTVYRYANNDTLLAVLSMKNSLEAHPPAFFFARLGMHDTVAETDWQGNYVLSSQVWSTARDLARLGQLYLRDGVWNGERLLPEDWREYVSSAAGPQPEGPFGYGAGFWLMNSTQGVPADTFAGFGNRGQYLVIVPSRDLVIVRRGEDPAGNRFDIGAFTRDVLAAVGN